MMNNVLAGNDPSGGATAIQQPPPAQQLQQQLQQQQNTNHGGGAPSMIPANQKAALERLERRVGSYNRHHDTVLPQYNEAMSASYKREVNETLILRQRYVHHLRFTAFP